MVKLISPVDALMSKPVVDENTPALAPVPSDGSGLVPEAQNAADA